MTRKEHDGYDGYNQQTYHPHQNTTHGQANLTFSPKKIAEEVAYADPSTPTSNAYPTEIEIEDHGPQASTQESVLPQGYALVARCWEQVNPNAQQITSPVLNPGYIPYASPSYYNDSHHRSTAMLAEKQRPTQEKLRILDCISPPVGSSKRYEQQGQRAGVWNGVGCIKEKRNGN